MCVQVHISVCVCVRACGGQRSTLVFSLIAFHLFVEMRSLNLKLTDWLDQLTNELQGFTCLCPPPWIWGCRHHHNQLSLNVAMEYLAASQTEIIKQYVRQEVSGESGAHTLLKCHPGACLSAEENRGLKCFCLREVWQELPRDTTHTYTKRNQNDYTRPTIHKDAKSNKIKQKVHKDYH